MSLTVKASGAVRANYRLWRALAAAFDLEEWIQSLFSKRGGITLSQGELSAFVSLYESIRKKSSVVKKFYNYMCFCIFQSCVNPFPCYLLQIYPTANASKVPLAWTRQKEKKVWLRPNNKKSISLPVTNTVMWYCSSFFSSTVFNTKVTHKHCFFHVNTDPRQWSIF